MRVITIEGTMREELGSKSAKDLRREGNVPCVIYGGEKNIHFSAPQISFKELLYTAEALLVQVKLGSKTFKSVVREAQYHPVTDDLEHLDFYELIPGVPITIAVPINLVGNARGVRNGGRMKVNLRKLRVKASEENLPGKINIDIENLRIGEAIRVEDIKKEADYEILHEPYRTILTIQTARNAVEDLDLGEDEDEEGAEGEEATAEGGAEETTASEA